MFDVVLHVTVWTAMNSQNSGWTKDELQADKHRNRQTVISYFKKPCDFVSWAGYTSCGTCSAIVNPIKVCVANFACIVHNN